MESLKKRTLSAWLLVETLLPGEIKNKDNKISGNYFIHGENINQVNVLEKFFPFWETDYFNLKEKYSESHNLSFKMYRYAFEFQQVHTFLEKLSSEQHQNNNYHTNHKLLCFSYTFELGQDGIVNIDTLHVPILMYALKATKERPHPKIYAEYKETMEKFKERATEILANNVLTEKRLNDLDKLYSKYFHAFNYPLNYVSIEITAKDQEPLPEFNSFYIEDLELALNSPNDTLSQFIEGSDQERLDVDVNRPFIEEILHPKFMPDGRFPSLIEHHPALMQQVAINHITSFKGNISSVNGPPGTGKTTLLKDIFAHFVVERAKIISNYSSQYKAFNKKKVNTHDTRKTAFVDEALSSYKMVVASSNNGAVENISKDLPKKSEIFHDEYNKQHIHYEKELQNTAKQLQDTAKTASNLIGEDAWGLFTGIFGKSKNIDNVLIQLMDLHSDNPESTKLLTILKNLNDKNSKSLYADFKEMQQSFKKTLNKVHKIKKDIEKDIATFYSYDKKYKSLQDLISNKDNLENQIEESNRLIAECEHKASGLKITKDSLDKQLENISEIISAFEQKPNFFERLVGKNKSKSPEELKHIEKRNKILEEQNNIIQSITNIEQKLHETKFRKNDLLQKIDSLEKDINESSYIKEKLQEIKNKYTQDSDIYPNIYTVPDDVYWHADNYDYRQQNTLWITDELQYERGLLFLKAMILHQHILIANHEYIKLNLEIFKERHQYLKQPKLIENAWNTIHLIFPVISTTFASFSNMYKTMPENFIDYLFIDEAGQAIPQAAAGALYRSKKAIIVGDPIQIEPVVTIDSDLLGLVRKLYHLPEYLLEKTASVQTLADNANPFGYYKGENEFKQWNGIPLWVHRRCLDPMFSISNEIAYENKMVLAKNDDTGKVGWYDVSGNSVTKQFVQEQGDKLVELILQDWSSDNPDVYVISPFTEVVIELKKCVKKALLEATNKDEHEIKNWVNQSIGTVHTFQGKEAKKVYFVIGTDNTQNGAINWSCSTPNLINVAITRAKKEFYVIGDYKRIRKFPYYEVIDQYKNI